MSRGPRPRRPRGDRGGAAAADRAGRARRPAPSSTSTRPAWAPSPPGSSCRRRASPIPSGWSITHTDVTARVRGEQALAWQATHDELTGLPNRAALLRLIGAALDTPRRASGTALLVHRPRRVQDGQRLPRATSSATRCSARSAGRLVEQVRPGRRRRPARRRPVRRPRPGLRLGRGRGAGASGCRPPSAPRSTPRASSVPLSASIGVAVRPRRQPRRRTSCSATPTRRCSPPRAPAATGCTCSRPRCARRPAGGWRSPPGCATTPSTSWSCTTSRSSGSTPATSRASRPWCAGSTPSAGCSPPDSFLSVAEETGQIIPITRWLLRETTAARGRVGGRGAAAAHVGQRQRPALLGRDPGPRRARRAAGLGAAARPAGPGAHRDLRRGGPQPRRGPADGAAQLRRPGGDRRLRHGLVLAGPAVRAADRHPEDRPVAAQRRRAGRRRRDRGRARGDRRAHPHPGHPVGRRGRGDRRAPAHGARGRAATWPRATCSASRCRPSEIPGWVRGVQAAGGDLCALAARPGGARSATPDARRPRSTSPTGADGGASGARTGRPADCSRAGQP